jgi:hypothetical protein
MRLREFTPIYADMDVGSIANVLEVFAAYTFRFEVG